MSSQTNARPGATSFSPFSRPARVINMIVCLAFSTLSLGTQAPQRPPATTSSPPFEITRGEMGRLQIRL